MEQLVERLPEDAWSEVRPVRDGGGTATKDRASDAVGSPLSSSMTRLTCALALGASPWRETLALLRMLSLPPVPPAKATS